MAAPGRWIVQVEGLTGTPAEQVAAFDAVATSLGAAAGEDADLLPRGNLPYSRLGTRRKCVGSVRGNGERRGKAVAVELPHLLSRRDIPEP